MSLLSLKDVTLGYGAHPLIEGINAALQPGEVATLLGPNGAGKSTLLRALGGTLTPMRGTIEVGGRDLSTAPRTELARLVAVVNTDRATSASSLTAREVVEMGRHPWTGFLGRLTSADRLKVDEALESVGAAGLASRRLGSLSDGERQKVMIARALAQDTPVILLDEPTSFLDVASRLETLSLLRSLAKGGDTPRAILLSSHDIPSALRLSDTLWLMMRHPDGTRRLLTGTPSALSADPSALPSLFAGRSVEFSPTLGDFVPSQRP